VRTILAALQDGPDASVFEWPVPDVPDFALLMQRLRQGDQEAARLIFHRFAGRLIALARSRLDERLRQKVGPEDVMQSALKSFFLRHAAGQFDLDNWDSLWALLTVITLRKCGHKVEHFRAACRDVRRESAAPAGDDSAASWQAIAREPLPDEAALMAETLGQLFAGLGADDRRIVELALQGHTPQQISESLGVLERTVYRRLERVKARLERLRAGDAPG
jgi:RNA polymerase sigma-70 factor (ECF subfamily)